MFEEISSTEVIPLLRSDNDFLKMTNGSSVESAIIILVLRQPELRTITVIKFTDDTELYIVNYHLHFEPGQFKVIQKMEVEYYTSDGRQVLVAYETASH